MPPAPGPDLLPQLAGLGPFFTLDSHHPDSAPDGPWRTMDELLAGDALTSRVEAVRAGLAAAAGRPPEAVEFRVAASIAQLGLVARLVSPVLGTAALTGAVLDVDLGRTRWQPILGGPFPVSVPTDAIPAGPVDPTPVATAISRQVLAGPVAALVEATGASSVSRHILWGNVASAVHGATTMIATARPTLADAAQGVEDRLFDAPPLRGTAANGPGPFRRRSCCLIYRVAGDAHGAVCGDCVLD